jgi:phosphonate degradation associated HDIG domain protein
MTSPTAADTFVAELTDLFVRLGGLRYGEGVTQMEHALQTAHHARQDGAPPDMIAAALLHDVGHMMQKIGENAADLGVDARHEHISAGYLARAFGPEVTEPIRLHVAAKRYRVAVDPAYLQRLSPASLQSLALQGGPMTPDEIGLFLADPWAEAALRLREYDEAGKVPEAEVASFETYQSLLREQIGRRKTQAMPDGPPGETAGG